MTDKAYTIQTMCRFCLCSDDLIPFSEAITTAFDFEDVVHYTGLVMAKDEKVFVCDECCSSINESKNFRLTCLRNDSIFKKLVGFNEWSAKRNITVTCVTPKGAESKIQRSTQGLKCDNGIITLNVSESDDSSSPCVQSVADETNNCILRNVKEKPLTTGHDIPDVSEQRETETTTASLHDEVMQESLNGESSEESFDDGGSQESWNDTAIQASSNAKLIKETDKEKDTKQTTENNEEMQTTDRTWINRNRETSTNWSKRKRSSADASDSDDSITSLYSEWKEKITSDSLPMEYGPSSTIQSEGDVKFTRCTNVIPNNTDGELCFYCGLKMKKQLTGHIQRTHLSVKRFKCPHCPKKYQGKFHLKQHINSQHERRIVYTCEQCGKGFVCRSSYDYHMANSHGKSDVYECETCHRKLRSWDGYKKHLKEHSLTALKCEDCGRLYKNTVTLEKHKLQYHSS